MSVTEPTGEPGGSPTTTNPTTEPPSAVPPVVSPPVATPPTGPSTATTPPTPPGPSPGNGGAPPLPGTGGGPALGTAGMAPTGSGGASPGGSPGGGGMDIGPGGTVGIAGMNAGGMNAGGTGGIAVPREVVPTMSGQDYSLALTSGTLVANGPTGRITQLVVAGSNKLTTSSVNPMNYGSSFWTAPQSVWSWPPPLDAIDETTPRTDYTHAIDGNAIVFTSPATAQGDESVSVTKRFTADAGRDAWVLEFTITNEGTSAISAAPWQVSRVVPQGFTFYPAGTDVTAEAIPVSQVAGVTWIDYSDEITSGSKNIADGAEGWLAHVDGGLLFLKVFPEISQAMAAPGEGEVEIYVDTDAGYVELEPQGAYASIQPGATSEPWQVLWLVRTVPADVEVSLGSESLVAWVRSLVALL
jgi:hypothetical protein